MTLLAPKKPGQVGHIEGGLVAIAAIDFVSCSKILTGSVLGHKRLVVIGGKVSDQTAIVARQDTGGDMHVPLLSAIYVDFEAAADAYLTRSESVHKYADEAKSRNETVRSVDLRRAATKLSSLSASLRAIANARDTL